MIATDWSHFFLHDSVEAIGSNHDCYWLIWLLPIAPIGAFFGTWHRGGRGNSNKGGGVCQASNRSNWKQSWLLRIALISFYMTQLKHRQSEAIMIAIDWYDCYRLLPLVHFLAHGTGGTMDMFCKNTFLYLYFLANLSTKLIFSSELQSGFLKVYLPSYPQQKFKLVNESSQNGQISFRLSKLPIWSQN